MKGYPWHEKIMAANTAARAEGVEVWPQVSCRPLTFQMNLREPFTFNMRPTFQELMDRPDRRRASAAYRDPAWRARAWDELAGPSAARAPDELRLAARRRESTTHPELIGRKVTDVAAERGCTPFDVMLDISLEENLETRFTSVLANNDPEAIAWLLPQDTVLLGLADSGAHVSQLCDACFATDLLGNWVRDKEVMPLEHAIHKLTGEPAGVFGLHDRGTIEVGKAADVVVFDYDTIGARSAAPHPRLPRRRRATRRRQAGGHAPRDRQRHGHPRRRAAGRRRARAAAGQAPAFVAHASSLRAAARRRVAARDPSGSSCRPRCRRDPR